MIRKVSFSTKNLTKVKFNQMKCSFYVSKLFNVENKKLVEFSAFKNKNISHSFSTKKVVSQHQLSTNNALQSMQLIEKFISSDNFKKHFNSYYYLQKYSWICIHTWMLLYRIRKCQNFSEVISGYILKKKILKLIEEYTRDQVYEYDDIFDREIYQELKRVQQVIFWSLDQYFVFNIQEKSLSQIIEEDFSLFWDVQQNSKEREQQIEEKQKDLFEGLENNQKQPKYKWQKEEQIEKVKQYFLTNLQEIQNFGYDKIKRGQLGEWLRI